MRGQTEVYSGSNMTNMEEEHMEDDDTHFCLRCNMTVHGLEQYIIHRKSKCSMNVGNPESMIVPSTSTADSILHVYDLNIPGQVHVSPGSRPDPVLSLSSSHMDDRLNSEELMNHLGLSMVSSSSWATDMNAEEPLRADDFFSLLELQSCTKSFKTPETRCVKPVRDSDGKHTDLSESNTEQATLATEQSVIPSQHARPAREAPEDPNTSNWLPDYNNLTSTCTETRDWNPAVPAPYPSRGKWMPGTKPRDIHKTGSSVEYHCKPCNRRLTNRHVYERHLKSELHFKKTSQSSSPAVTGKYELRTTRKPSVKRVAEDLGGLSDDDSDMSWIRRKLKDGIRCRTCSAWVAPSSFGKHLVSRFHVSRSRNHPENVDYILKHMDLIVREAPFQCSLCRFYSHSHSSFMTHWKSVDHAERNAVSQGTFYCSVCQLNCSSHMQMQLHLESDQHLECVAVINKSVPVVISKPHFVQCHLCVRSFRYRIQLNKHLAASHPQEIQAPDSNFHCRHCSFSTDSKSAFTHHKFRHSVNNAGPLYQCLICQMEFSTKDEAKKHRSTQQHRDLSRSNKEGILKERSCPHCYEKFNDVLDFRKHLKGQHSSLLPRCTTCGAQFVLKQELSAHRRSGCTGGLIRAEEKASYVCDICSCTCSSRSEVLYHKAVEHQHLFTPGNFPATADKLACAECGLYYTKSALKMHVLSHTDEFPFRCPHCVRRFSSQPELERHVQILHRKKKIVLT